MHPPIHPSSRRLLLLILDQLHIILRHLRMRLQQPIKDIITQVALDRNLLAPLRRLGHARTRSKLLSHLLAHLLQIHPVLLQPAHRRHILPFIPLDPLDNDFGLGQPLRLPRLGRFGFGGFLLRVFLGALLGVYGECRQVGRDGVGRVELGVQGGVVRLKPVFAFFGGAAEFTVLLSGLSVSCCFGALSWLGRNVLHLRGVDGSPTYFGWETADWEIVSPVACGRSN